MYAPIKNLLRSAGFNVSEGDELMTSDHQAMRDYFAHNGVPHDIGEELHHVLTNMLGGVNLFYDNVVSILDFTDDAAPKAQVVDTAAEEEAAQAAIAAAAAQKAEEDAAAQALLDAQAAADLAAQQAADAQAALDAQAAADAAQAEADAQAAAAAKE